ncbi:het domain-containing protein [Colletotrichum incanum]|uniref:Het domain-containing protein n=1 Tax=Colletotrichum incanum TaxID=1573173 RepID=A0A167D468_COLIC|nr:het domain-containing protein [Colletotrichum incanum]
MSAYQSQHGYEPLSSPDAFRLLLLEPSASRTAELRGSLLNTTLAACDYDLIDPYTALSYVWGSPEKPCRICLDGHDGNLFAITKSLDDALRDLRDATRVRRVWADALCIDQLNVAERNADGDEALRVLSDMNSSRASKARIPLHRAIQARRGLGATDTRDFVYANFGIISDLAVVNNYLRVDYSMSLAETFGKSPHPIGPLEDGRRLTTARSPSWAPDWTRRASYTTPVYKDNHLNHMKLKGIPHAFADGNHPLVLGHIGYEVDVIEGIHAMRSNDWSLDLPVEYEQAKTDLLSMYKNAYASGDKFGSYRHIPLKGRKAQHEALCNIIGSVWARLFKDYGEEPYNMTSEHVDFFDSLALWTSAQAKKQREFVGSGARGLMKLLYGYFERTKGQSNLDGWCLVSTRNGNFGVAPCSARPGDHIVYLAGSETAVIIRRTSELGQEGVERALLHALRQPGHGVISVANQNGEKEFWKMPAQGDVSVSHFDVVGEGYMDDYTGWSLKDPPKTSDMRVFALH